MCFIHNRLLKKKSESYNGKIFFSKVLKVQHKLVEVLNSKKLSVLTLGGSLCFRRIKTTYASEDKYINK